MRVTLVVGSMPPMRCGVGDYTAQLAAALSERDDVQVAVVTSIGAGAAESFVVDPIGRTWDFSELRPILRAIRGSRPDVVHFQFPSAGYGAGILRLVLPTVVRLLGTPVVQTWHEYQHSLFLSELPNAILPGALIAVRPEYLEHSNPMIRKFTRWKRFQYIPNASSIPGVELSAEERAAVKSAFTEPGKRLIAFFGFMHRHKGVETLFDVTTPERDHLLVIGQLSSDDPYHAEIRSKLEARGSATTTGFVDGAEAARLLAAADAVVLPFREGGGAWNSSLHAANAQGTFAIITSTERAGYDQSLHTFFVAPGDLQEIRRALDQYAGTRADIGPAQTGWTEIADAHLQVYRSLARK